MAAQFADVRLPERHEVRQLVELPDGDYCCRITQMFDPESEGESRDEADFIVSFTQPPALPAVWSEIPWFSA